MYHVYADKCTLHINFTKKNIHTQSQLDNAKHSCEATPCAQTA